MKELKYTKGKWKTKYKINVESDNRSICSCGVQENLNKNCNAENEANARLIAAAPEMLDCLINNIKEYKKLYPKDWELFEEIQESIIVIEKATGLKIEELL